MLPAHLQAILSGQYQAANITTAPVEKNAPKRVETPLQAKSNELLELPEIETHSVEGDNTKLFDDGF